MKCLDFLFHTRLAHSLCSSVYLSIFCLLSSGPLAFFDLLLAAATASLSLQFLLELSEVVCGVLLLCDLTEFYHV